MRARRLFANTLLVLLIASAGRAAASVQRIEGVSFPTRVEVAGENLQLNCLGLMRYLAFIKAYVAGLYLGESVKPEEVLSDVPKRLEIEYFYAIEAADFAKATNAKVAENVTPTELARLRPRIDQLNALYESVEPGDRYSLTYLPGLGTELALNGQRKGVVEGADFAAAVFSIWLGRKPVDHSLKDQLLECS